MIQRGYVVNNWRLKSDPLDIRLFRHPKPISTSCRPIENVAYIEI